MSLIGPMGPMSPMSLISLMRPIGPIIIDKLFSCPQHVLPFLLILVTIPLVPA